MSINSSNNFDQIVISDSEKSLLDMIWINPDNFIMGSPQTENDRGSSESQFKVEISKGYWIGKYPVTQFQWNELMNVNSAKLSFEELNKPATHVNWQDAMAFCEKLNNKYKQILPEGYQFSLPTEAMWEYACRAGTTTSRYNSDSEENLSEIAWFNKNSNQQSHAVGLKNPNPWGLFDMLGNVYEWCFDDFMLYPQNSAIDWMGKKDGELRTMKTFRGGAWSSSAPELRAAARGYAISDEYTRKPWFGFRIALAHIKYD